MKTQEREPTAFAVPPTDAPHLEHRRIVSKVVSSSTFIKSERLCTLLTYVCDMTLKGRAAEIHEQKIGHAVFGRARDYDSSVDGIVRTQASRLRQRLETYYQHEGAQDPVRIAIPRGSYVPQFRVLAASPPLPEMAAETAPQIAPATTALPVSTAEIGSKSKPAHSWVVALILLCLCLALALGGLYRFDRRTQAASAPTFNHPLWSRIFVPGQPTLEVPGDSALVLFHGFEHRTIPLNEYVAGAYRQTAAYDKNSPWPLKNLPSETASRRYTSIVDLEAATTFTRIAETAHSSLQVRYARDIRPNDLKTGNVILFGATEANPWVELFERNMNFPLHIDQATRVFTVLNRSPKADEPSQWVSAPNDPEHRVYGVISYMPSLTGEKRVLVVEGTSMAGCESAMDFLSDDSQLLPFLDRIRRADGELPHFEVLLSTQNTGASAVHSSIVAWRVKD